MVSGKHGVTGRIVHARAARVRGRDTGTARGLSMAGLIVRVPGQKRRTAVHMNAQVSSDFLFQMHGKFAIKKKTTKYK